MPLRSRYATREQYNLYFREYYKKNAERMRGYKKFYNAKWRKDNKDKHLGMAKKYRENHPEEIKCRHALQYAVKIGEVKRLPCQVCGSPKSQAHHDDYSKPLEVKWFCALHHREYHDHKEPMNEDQLPKIDRSKLVEYKLDIKGKK